MDSGKARILCPAVGEALLLKLAEALNLEHGSRRRVLRRLVVELRQSGDRTARALVLVMADLLSQDWGVEIAVPRITLIPPPEIAAPGQDIHTVKERRRAALLAGRADQLASPAVRAFLSQMERPRVTRAGLSSVRCLVDRGSSLAEELRKIASLPLANRAAALDQVIRPSIELIQPGQRCEATGLLLTHIWRYFRHTWSLQYRSAPGRTILFLIRNLARENHPVMAIGGLASSLPVLSLRDHWIGWTSRGLKSALERDPQFWPEQRTSFLRTLNVVRDEIRSDDLLLEAPHDGGASLESWLQQLGHKANAVWRTGLEERHAQSLARKRSVPLSRLPIDATGVVDWRAASESPLFVRKRARLLSEVLFAIRVLTALPSEPIGPQDLFSSDAVQRALSIALREIRKRGLASRVLDLSVCGAVAPYGGLLAGKLAALAPVSREVAEAYAGRYQNRPSDIASQIAGREILRPANLCALTTTSLYGVTSSQYNRARITVTLDSIATEIRWEELGTTSGLSPVHLSQETVKALRSLAVARRGARLVNYVFGEGPSPRFRQVREGLEFLGLDPDDILQHNSRRRVYGLAMPGQSLADLRLDRPCLAPRPSCDQIARAWVNRWLIHRIARPDVLLRVASEGPETISENLADPGNSQLTLF
jgi:hypothetical protein